MNRGNTYFSFPWGCWRCCCSVCTHKNCPYSKGSGPYQYRCASCASGETVRICLECDTFENKYTVGRHFHYRIDRRKKGEIEKRLDAIMQAVGAKLPDDVENLTEGIEKMHK